MTNQELLSGIDAARQNGYSDDEIFSHLSKRNENIKTALEHYSPEEIYNHLSQQNQNQNQDSPTSTSTSTPTPIEPGNIDLNNRPIVKNEDGSISTVDSMSFGTDRGEILIPQVARDGSRVLEPEEAIKQYQETGEHLGIFKTPEEADIYGKQLSEEQRKLYNPANIEEAVSIPPVENPGLERIILNNYMLYNTQDGTAQQKAWEEAKEKGYNEYQFANAIRETVSNYFDSEIETPLERMPSGPVDTLKSLYKGEITVGDVVEDKIKRAGDTGLAYLRGGTNLIKFAGDIYGLATGDFGNKASVWARQTIEDLNYGKSEATLADEEDRANKIASFDSVLGQAFAAVSATVSNPNLMSQFVSEQLPNLLAAGGAAGLTRVAAEKVLLKKMVEQAATRWAARAAVAGAAATDIASNVADLAGDQYDRELIRISNMSEEEASELPPIKLMLDEGASLEAAKSAYALSQARKTGAIVGLISLGTQFIPGAQTLEKALAGESITGSRLLAGAIGAGAEATQEVLQEGGGLYASNIIGERPATENLGETIGMAALMGGVFGGGSGLIIGGAGQPPSALISVNPETNEISLAPNATPLAVQNLYNAFNSNLIPVSEEQKQQALTTLSTIYQEKFGGEIQIIPPVDQSGVSFENNTLIIGPHATLSDIATTYQQIQQDNSIHPALKEQSLQALQEAATAKYQQLALTPNTDAVTNQQRSIPESTDGQTNNETTSTEQDQDSGRSGEVTSERNEGGEVQPAVQSEISSTLVSPTISENGEITYSTTTGGTITEDQILNLPEEDTSVTLPVVENQDIRTLIEVEAEAARNLGPGAASSLEFQRRRAAIGAEILLEGGNKKEWTARMREIYPADEMSGVELNEIWKDSNNLLKDYYGSQVTGTVNIAAQINQSTGVSPQRLALNLSNFVSRFRAYKEVLKERVKNAKQKKYYEDKLEAQRVANEDKFFRDQYKFNRKLQKEKLKAENAGQAYQRDLVKLMQDKLDKEVETIRQMLIKALQEQLPVSERGKYVGKISKTFAKAPNVLTGNTARLHRDASEILTLIYEHRENLNRTLAIEQLNKLTEKVAPRHKERIDKALKAAQQNAAGSPSNPVTRMPLPPVDPASQDAIAAIYAALIPNISNLSAEVISAWINQIEQLAEHGRQTTQQHLDNLKAQVDTFYGELDSQGSTSNLDSWSPLRLWQAEVTLFSHRLYQLMDGKVGGVISKMFGDRFNTNNNLYLIEIKNLRQQIQDFVTPLNLSQEQYIKIRLYAELQQKDGYETLLNVGVDPNDIAYAQSLTTEEQAFYDFARNKFEEFFNQISPIHEKITGQKLFHTENYWPRMRDWEISNTKSLFEDRFDTKAERDLSFLKERKGKIKSLQLDAMTDLQNYADDAMYYIHTADTIATLRAIISNEEGQTLIDRIGETGFNLLKDQVDILARKQQAQGNRFRPLENVMRSQASFKLLGRPITFIIQFTGLMYAIGTNTVSSIANSAAQIIANPDARQWVDTHFPEIGQALDSELVFLELQRRQGTESTLTTWKNNVERFNAISLAFGDAFFSRRVIALATVMDMRGENRIDFNSPPTTEEVLRAQERVVETAGSNRLKDLPQSLQRGKGFGGHTWLARSMMIFQNFTLTRWNRFSNDIAQLGLEGYDRRRAVQAFTGEILGLASEVALRTAYQVGNKALIAAFAGGRAPDEKEEDDFYNYFRDNLIGESTGRIPIMGGIVEYGIRKRLGLYTFKGQAGVPALDFTLDFFNLSDDIATITSPKKVKGEKGGVTPIQRTRAIFHATRTILPVLPIPNFGSYGTELIEKGLIEHYKEEKRNESRLR